MSIRTIPSKLISVRSSVYRSNESSEDGKKARFIVGMSKPPVKSSLVRCQVDPIRFMLVTW
jgi:hypothetical protein